MNVDWRGPLRLENKMAEIMTAMSFHGWLVDQPRMHELLGILNEKIETIDAKVLPRIPLTPVQMGVVLDKPFKKNGELKKAVIDWMEHEAEEVVGPFCRIKWQQINLGSDKQVKDFLLAVGWKPTTWNFDKKTKKRTSPKLTEDSFDSLKDDTGKLVAERMKYKHRRSLIEGLFKLIRPDGRISQVISGMASTYRYTHKGIVNIPGADAVFGLEIRSIFTSPPGYKIVGCDAASCQLRMLCHYMGDEEYTQAVLYGKKEDGTDIHSVNMRKTEGLLDNRTDAKRFIYGLLFGAGDPKLGLILNGTARDGKRLREKFMAQLPTLDRLLQGLRRKWKKCGYIVGLDGRKVFVSSEHMLLVYLVQSAEAILMKVAGTYLDMWIKKEELDAHIVAFVHDEYQAEVREDHVERYKVLAERAIEKAGQVLGLHVPTKGEADSGDTWADTH